MGKVINGMIRIFSYANPAKDGLEGYAPIAVVLKYVKANSPEYFIVEYDSRDDLIAQCDGILNGLKQKPALEILEVLAHGTPSRVNRMWTEEVTGGMWDGLARLRWADNASIYLCGCNTGTRLRSFPGWPNVAECLANRIPAVPKAFRCTVYGTVGYYYGSHAGKDGRAVAIYTDPQGNVHASQLYARDDKFDPSQPFDVTFRGFRGPDSA